MGRKSERGEGKLGGLILLVVVLAGGLAAWNIVPVYFDHYDFVDKVNEICRTPPYKARKGDETIKEMLMTEVAKRRLGTWIGPESFAITTHAPTRGRSTSTTSARSRSCPASRRPSSSASRRINL